MMRIFAQLVVCLAFCGTATRGDTQSFVMTGGILAAPWQPIAISANGNKIYIPTFPDSILGSPPGYYHSSYDNGKTWTKQTGSGNRFWVIGCASSDGTIVYGADQGSISGLIYKSTDSGVTWAATGSPSLQWQQVSCSSDGSKLAACVGSQITQADIYTSVDGGATWVDQTGSLSRNYNMCVMSGDGTKIATSNQLGSGPNGDGKIYISTNWQSGSPVWTGSNTATGGASFAYLSYSRDGSTLYAAFTANGNSSHVFVTKNDGGLWTDVNPPGETSNQHNWFWVACSANGNTVIAGNTVFLYVSTNGGTSWSAGKTIKPNGPSLGSNAFFAVSDDGSTIVEALYGGFVSISHDSGATWQITSATGP